MSGEINPHHLRALACDIEDCHNPQSWADYCRAAAAMLETQAARIAELEAALGHATEYVGRLAVTLAEKHYPDQRFELLPNLLGRIDQIDNMTCGLTRAALEGGKS